MYGLKGKTEEIVLKNKSDTFEKNKVGITKKYFLLKIIYFYISER